MNRSLSVSSHPHIAPSRADNPDAPCSVGFSPHESVSPLETWAKAHATSSFVERVNPVCFSRGYRPRRGIMLLAATISLVVLSAISISLVRSVLARIQEASLHEQQQADALAESAIQRGIAQRTINPVYPGEVWAPSVPGSPRLQATIEWVESSTGASLRVVCLVPADAVRPVRVERVAPFPAPLPVKAE